MKLPCFKRFGIVFHPNNLIGWLILLTGVIYSVNRFTDIDCKSHSASDTIRPFLINLFFIFIAYNIFAIIANLLSGNNKHLQD